MYHVTTFQNLYIVLEIGQGGGGIIKACKAIMRTLKGYVMKFFGTRLFVGQNSKGPKV
jgi:hypothetical protein